MPPKRSKKGISAVGFEIGDWGTVNIGGDVHVHAGAKGREMTDKASTGEKRRAPNRRKVAAKRKIEDRGEKIKKKRKKTTGKFLPKDFEKNSKLGMIKKENKKSTKPDLLLETVESEVYHERQSQAAATLQNALVYWQTHSRSSYKDLLKLTSQCTNSRVPLRTVLFHVFAAVKMKAGTAENGKYYSSLSKHIFEVWCLLQKMNNGVHYEQVAKFAPSVMSQIYDLGCDKASAKCRSYALSWIAVAYSHIKDYENAFQFGKKGLQITNAEFPQIKERRKEQCYARLLECVGLGYEYWKGQYPTALKNLKASVVATRMGKWDVKSKSKRKSKRKSKSKRETSLSIRSGHVQRVHKKITSQGKEK